MITNFRVKNFRSIVDMELSLAYDEGKAPNGYKEWDTWAFLEDKKTGVRTVPCLALYGANASGKSNIVLALNNFMRFVNVGSISAFDSEGAPLLQPNRIHSDEDVCVYSIQVIDSSYVIDYEISHTKDEVLSETLTINGKELFHCNSDAIFIDNSIELPNYDRQRLLSIHYVECCSTESGETKQIGLFLHTLGQKYPGLNSAIRTAYLALTNSYCFPVTSFKDHIYINEDGFEQATQLVKQFDLDIIDIASNDNHEVKTYHLNNKKEKIEFELSDESLGTQNLLGLLIYISFVLQYGLTIVVDELDRSIHPLILIQIVSLFKSKEYNKKGAQLIFTTHTTDLLDAENLLRVSEVGIVNKTKISGTTVTRLSEFEGLRNVKNFRKSYMNGEFRGIPYPFI